MATGMLAEFNTLNIQQYERINDGLNLYDRPPKGLIFHAAGPTNSGTFWVFDIWESKEIFEQFLIQQLQPVFKQIGLTEQPRVEFYQIHNAYVPQPNVLPTLTNVGTGVRR